MKPIDLTGRLAIVSGGGGEIGYALCVGLADAGARVVALDINTDRIDGKNDRISALRVDLSNVREIDKAVEQICADHVSVDILVHAAGINVAAAVAEFDEQAWDDVFNVNLKSAFFLTKSLIPHFGRVRAGKIVFISSISAKLGYPGLHAYTASKGGLDALVRNLSTELAAKQICVNGLAPGTTKTGMTKGLWEDEEKCRAHEATIPLGRMANCEDHVGPLLFLCSELSDYVTGQILCCDGGLTSVQADFIDLKLRGQNE
jgi:NAD(P)-dependent dehydrogenase (short-subunit alcohol dehydrogenase family)